MLGIGTKPITHKIKKIKGNKSINKELLHFHLLPIIHLELIILVIGLKTNSINLEIMYPIIITKSPLINQIITHNQSLYQLVNTPNLWIGGL